MRDTRKKQLSINLSDPHHLTVLKYPVLDLLIDGNEEPVVLPPEHAASMHTPGDLIHDPGVAENANTFNEAETAFFTIERANVRHLNPRPALFNEERPAFDRLKHDVAIYQRSVGSTHLEIACYRSVGKDRTLRVRRKSAARCAGALWRPSMEVYEFPLAELLNSSDTSPAFVRSMIMLVKQQNSRAVRHVELMLEEYDAPEWLWDEVESYKFKPPRLIDYTESLDKVMRRVDTAVLDTEDQQCSICSIPFGEQGPTQDILPEDPAVLPCGHVFGADCLTTTFNAAPPEQARTCPMCRQSPLTPMTVNALTFGLSIGIYHPDERYRAFQNFERSCADLDDHVDTSIDDTAIKARAFLIAKLGPGGMAIRELVTLAKHYIRNELHDQAMAPIKHLSGPDSRLAILNEQSSAAVFGNPFRPGFEEFLDHLISRAVHFQKKRACSCTQGFHRHGVRIYYNARGSYEVKDRGAWIAKELGEDAASEAPAAGQP